MIKANELRIGNYVDFDTFIGDTFHQRYTGGSVTGIMPDGVYINEIRIPEAEFLQPIVLTEEWLMNFGFEKTDSNWNEYNLFYKQDGFRTRSLIIYEGVVSPHWNHDLTGVFYLKTGTVEPQDNGEYGNPETVFKPIEFVHQLQNLYFALTGEELTIKEHV